MELGGRSACRCVGVRRWPFDWLTIEVGGGGPTSHINTNMKVPSHALVSVIQSRTQRPLGSSRDLPPLLFGRYQIILSETSARTAEINSLSVFTDCTCLLPSRYPHGQLVLLIWELWATEAIRTYCKWQQCPLLTAGGRASLNSP